MSYKEKGRVVRITPFPIGGIFVLAHVSVLVTGVILASVGASNGIVVDFDDIVQVHFP